MLSDICGTDIPGVYTREGKIYAEQLLVRIVNQNEQARGLFYLHPDADVGIATPSVALLRISIALRREHYHVLRGARIGRIDPEFSAKLGWLTGNLYSRVATPDWDEKNGKNSAKKLAKSMLDSVSDSGGQNWVPEQWLNAARNANMDFTTLNHTNAVSVLQHHAPLEPIEIITERFERVSRELILTEQAPRIRDALRHDAQFIESVCHTISTTAVAVIGTEESVELGARLQASADFGEAIANQVQAVVKRAAREHSTEPIESVCSTLEVATGTIPPLIKVINQVATESGVLDVQIADLQASIRESGLFVATTTGRVREIMTEVLADGSLERMLKVIGRIRNDQQVKNALRLQ